MATSMEESRQQLLGSAAALVERQEGETSELLLTRYYRHMLTEELLTRRPEDLAGAALSHRVLAYQRQRGCRHHCRARSSALKSHVTPMRSELSRELCCAVFAAPCRDAYDWYRRAILCRRSVHARAMIPPRASQGTVHHWGLTIDASSAATAAGRSGNRRAGCCR